MVIALGVSTEAAAVLREASLQVTYTEATACEVAARFRIDPGDAPLLEHRLAVGDGTTVDVIEPARPAIPPRVDGRTRVLEIPVRPGEDVYTFRYRVVQPPDLRFRCPLWLPTVPADGRSRGVEIQVTVPAGATPAGGGFPSLEWDAGSGRTTLGHVPAFILTPFAASGDPDGAPWHISRLMDTTAVTLLVVGMGWFVLRKRR